MQKLARLTTALLLLVCVGVLFLRAEPHLRGADSPPAVPTPAAGAAALTADAPGSDAEPVGDSAQAAHLLHEAKQKLFAHKSVQADIREFVALGDRRFEAIGRYVAGPLNPLPQLRLEYHVRVGDTEGLLLEVCDGQILRSERIIRPIDGQSALNANPATASSAAAEADPDRDVTVTRRDVRKILEAVQKNGPTPETILQAELGIGGLPALLTSIERAMTFDSVLEEPLGGRRCYVLQGRWRPEFLADMQRHFAHFNRKIETFLPERVRIHLDAEMLFPVRITYWPPPTSDGRSLPPTLTLEFTKIRLNEPVDPKLFEFVSHGADESDVTDEYIQAIQAAAQANQPAAAPTTPALPR